MDERQKDAFQECKLHSEWCASRSPCRVHLVCILNLKHETSGKLMPAIISDWTQSPRDANLLISTIESSRQKFVKTYIWNTVRWFFSIRLQGGMWNQSCDLNNKGYHAKNSLCKRNGKDFRLLSCLQGRKKLSGYGRGFWNLKVHPKWHSSSYKDTLRNLSQTVPLTRDQIFKHMSPWEPLSLKPK